MGRLGRPAGGEHQESLPARKANGFRTYRSNLSSGEKRTGGAVVPLRDLSRQAKPVLRIRRGRRAPGRRQHRPLRAPAASRLPTARSSSSSRTTKRRWKRRTTSTASPWKSRVCPSSFPCTSTTRSASRCTGRLLRRTRPDRGRRARLTADRRIRHPPHVQPQRKTPKRRGKASSLPLKGDLRSREGSLLRADDEDDSLEELLLSADVGVEACERIMDALREARRMTTPVSSCGREFLDLLGPGRRNHSRIRAAKPRAIVVIGVNGVGKTTSIAKLAHPR